MLDEGESCSATAIVRISGFQIGIDTKRYSERMVRALRTEAYEVEERKICEKFFNPDDRVIEIGSAIGVVSLVLGR